MEKLNTYLKRSNLKTLKTIILLNLMLTSFLVLSTRIATFLHEVFGHTFIALISGGSVYRIKISMFGGGRVWADLTKTNIVILFLFCLSGIMINIITGILPVIFSHKTDRLSLRCRIFFIVFAMASLLGALAYLITGIYYEFGDPANWTSEIPFWFKSLWVPLMIIAPYISFYLARHYVRIQEQIIPSTDFIKRTVFTALTLGAALFTYLILFIITNQSLASTTASEAAFQREKARILETKRQELFSKIQKENPELTKIEILAIIENAGIQVDPNEVPKKLPILPMIMVLYLIGGMAALFKKPKYTETSNFRTNIWEVLLYCLIATVVVSILAYTGGYIY